jgi:hypothetical protein
VFDELVCRVWRIKAEVNFTNTEKTFSGFHALIYLLLQPKLMLEYFGQPGEEATVVVCFHDGMEQESKYDTQVKGSAFI